VVFAALCATAFAQTPPPVAPPAATPAAPHPETAGYANMRLWPGEAPGSGSVTGPEAYNMGKTGGRFYWNISHPMMTAFYAAKPSGAAVLIVPGGGYKAVFFDFAATYARWLNTIGVDAFVLKYRLPDEAGATTPLQDAQRAMRLIRTKAAPPGHSIDPARVGIMGLSAGGHLAAVLATYPDRKVYDAVDDSDKASARPDFLILGYAVLPGPTDYVGDERTNPMTQFYKSFPIGVKLTTVPPAFIMHGRKDNDVPYKDAEHFADALRHGDIPVELHIFDDVGHAFGVTPKGDAAQWPMLCEAWLRSRKLIP
jgi:acetyl esterase/lipase